MSDLSNRQCSDQAAFDSRQHLRALCEGTRLYLPPFVEGEYKFGWKTMMEDFIGSIKGYPLQICHLHDHFGELDIAFDILAKTREVNVWRAMDQFRTLSRQTCMSCGEMTSEHPNPSNRMVLCRHCFRKGGAKGNTGTWLDKY